jgi:hypothetical protein
VISAKQCKEDTTQLTDVWPMEGSARQTIC